MTGWNLPPGCSVSDIPGNSPQDLADEALMDQIYGLFADVKNISESDLDSVAERMFKLCGEVHALGYNQGMSDEAQANEERIILNG